MPETQPEEKRTKITPMTLEDFIWMQLQDFKDEFRDSRKELAARMDRIEQRQDKLEAKIDELSKKIDSSMNQGQICLITTIGILITVLYSIFSK